MSKTVLATLFTIGLAIGGAAQAATIGFANIVGGDTFGDAYNENFSLEVTDTSSGATSSALFRLSNIGTTGTSMFISTFYIDDTNPSSFAGTLPSAMTTSGGTGYVSMSRDSGGNLPQGNNVGFSTSFNFNRDTGGRVNSANAAGIQEGETGEAEFQLNVSFASLLTSLESGDLRLGIHVQSLPDGGQSDSYVTPLTPMPLPAAGWMLLAGVGGIAAMSRRKKKT